VAYLEKKPCGGTIFENANRDLIYFLLFDMGFLKSFEGGGGGDKMPLCTPPRGLMCISQPDKKK